MRRDPDEPDDVSINSTLADPNDDSDDDAGLTSFEGDDYPLETDSDDEADDE